MDQEHKNIEALGKDLDRRLLEIARKVDPTDEAAIDLYAGEITMDFCRAGFRDIAANLQAADPNAPSRISADSRKRRCQTCPSTRRISRALSIDPNRYEVSEPELLRGRWVSEPELLILR